MITYKQALTANHFQHVSEKNSDGTPVRARRSGRTQTWKREPGAFSIPVKYGLKMSFRIDWSNANQWEVAP